MSWGIVAATPVAVYYLWTIRVGLADPDGHVAGWHNFAWLGSAREWHSLSAALQRTGEHAVEWLWTAPFIAFAAIGAAAALRRRMRSRAAVSDGDESLADGWFVVWSAACLVLLVIGAQELRSNWWNFHIFNPPFAYFAGEGLLRVLRPLRKKSLQVVAGSCLLFAGALYGRRALVPLYDVDYTLRTYRMGLALGQVSASDELVVTIGQPAGDPLAIYYARRRGWVLPAIGPSSSDWSRVPARDEETVRRVETARRKGAKWLAMTRDHGRVGAYLYRASSRFGSYLRRRAELVEATPEFEIWRFRDAAGR